MAARRLLPIGEEGHPQMTRTGRIDHGNEVRRSQNTDDGLRSSARTRNGDLQPYKPDKIDLGALFRELTEYKKGV